MSLSAPPSYSETILQKVFNWRFAMTGPLPGEMQYVGEYMGCRVALFIETTRNGQRQQFARKRKYSWSRFESAYDLLASFPRLNATDE